jgi:hypothetical protein
MNGFLLHFYYDALMKFCPILTRILLKGSRVHINALFGKWDFVKFLGFSLKLNYILKIRKLIPLV